MEFSYKKWLAIKYFMFAVFLALIIFLTIPFILVFPALLLIDFGVIWLIVIVVKHAFSVDSRRIVVNKDGIYICRGKKLDDYISWNAISDYNMSEQRFSILVGERFFHITTELNKYNEFEDLMSGILYYPVEKRIANLPPIFSQFNQFPGKTVKVEDLVLYIQRAEKPETTTGQAEDDDDEF